MHQLPKDPQRTIDSHFVSTSASPQKLHTPFELVRYLDYCSELLSVIGKLGAVYMAKLDDPVIIAATNELESLTSGLSGKIWQKIMIVHLRTNSIQESSL
tara:strand:- start:233 stop:532 length:300 start_codon:yes stop_codon:yes gene_type:complete